MSILKNKAHKAFQGEPSSKNDYTAFDEGLGHVTQYIPAEVLDVFDGEEREARVAYFKNRAEKMAEADKRIKEAYGEDHFYGEVGMPLLMKDRAVVDGYDI